MRRSSSRATGGTMLAKALAVRRMSARASRRRQRFERRASRVIQREAQHLHLGLELLTVDADGAGRRRARRSRGAGSRSRLRAAAPSSCSRHPASSPMDAPPTVGSWARTRRRASRGPGRSLDPWPPPRRSRCPSSIPRFATGSRPRSRRRLPRRWPAGRPSPGATRRWCWRPPAAARRWPPSWSASIACSSGPCPSAASAAACSTSRR